MDNQYRIEYEALIHNFPLIQDFDYEGHIFKVNRVTDDINKDLTNSTPTTLYGNDFTFLSACYATDLGTCFVTLKDSTLTIPIIEDNESLIENALTKIESHISSLERHLLFISNAPIFFSNFVFKILRNDGTTVHSGLNIGFKPNKMRTNEYRNITANLEANMNFHFDRDKFNTFINDKKHVRYKLAFDYFIESFYQTNHSISFCLLCSSIDAITGSSERGLTKKRLAKYSTILNCNPNRKIFQINLMEEYYKLRSNYVYGKGSEISEVDEHNLRTFTRKFLISYYLFFLELGVKNDYELLQKLDLIYDNPKMYNELVPYVYPYIAVLNKIEKGDVTLANLNREAKEALITDSFVETLAE